MTLRGINFLLACLLACMFLGIEVYCLAHGVACWSALGFAGFSLLVALAIQGPRQS